MPSPVAETAQIPSAKAASGDRDGETYDLADIPPKGDRFGSDTSTFVEGDADPANPYSAPVAAGSVRGNLSSGRLRHTGIRAFCRSAWKKNEAPLLLLLAQFFGALMNLIARLLEVGEGAIHPMRLLFVRMSMTVIGASLYIWWRRIPHGVLGHKDVRWLLVLRGVCGFFGIYGMWYSAKYLTLADATVITFLAPNIAGYMCHILLHDSFTRVEQLASFAALGGVVLITRPVSLLSGSTSSSTSSMAVDVVQNTTTALEEASLHVGFEEHIPTNSERLGAVSFALLGVLGGAGAITSLRWIGKRAYPLISVNYFSAWCVVVSTTTLALAPALDYGQPDLRVDLGGITAWQWLLLVLIMSCGLIMQVLTATGLARERSNRATAMMYTHMLFAAFFDRWIFGHTMGWMSLTGCGLIIGSALWVALTKENKGKERNRDDSGEACSSARVAAAPSASADAVAMEIESAPVLSGDEDTNRGDEEEES
ncbi:hypothetical protein GGS23DRAFT_472361 [Durotheca rogersii]|uniref:uncharacterized protein n=1 Tax=Durotheca rogersii TaxID=419775 RepID=UPI0022209B90|nr:uncharacterized protein GGS23DRAFT_472361 [Durotheca rogersii]KAI5854525.1 hypothetical protein GGS23DRAFT_472361 [Durotheca rogersii]